MQFIITNKKGYKNKSCDKIPKLISVLTPSTTSHYHHETHYYFTIHTCLNIVSHDARMSVLDAVMYNTKSVMIFMTNSRWKEMDLFAGSRYICCVRSLYKCRCKCYSESFPYFGVVRRSIETRTRFLCANLMYLVIKILMARCDDTGYGMTCVLTCSCSCT